MAGKKKTQVGTVTSNKMDKTVVVEISRRVLHPVFHKYFVKKKRFKAHDEKNKCNIGDQVLIQESKPISCHKRWVVKEIVEI